MADGENAGVLLAVRAYSNLIRPAPSTSPTHESLLWCRTNVFVRPFVATWGFHHLVFILLLLGADAEHAEAELRISWGIIELSHRLSARGSLATRD